MDTVTDAVTTKGQEKGKFRGREITKNSETKRGKIP